MCHHQRRWQLRALASFKYMLRARHREALVRSLNHLTKWCSPVCHIVTRMVRSWNYTCAMHTQPSNRLYNTRKGKWKRKTQTMPRDRRCSLAAWDAATVPITQYYQELSSQCCPFSMTTAENSYKHEYLSRSQTMVFRRCAWRLLHSLCKLDRLCN